MPLAEDTIELKGMRFYGYHGFHSEEKRLGQPFLLDLKLFLSLKEAGEEDNLEKTVNYGEVYRLVGGIVEGEPYSLLEALAQKISQEVLSSFPLIKGLWVRVQKTSPPIPGILEGVSVAITRSRDG